MAKKKRPRGEVVRRLRRPMTAEAMLGSLDNRFGGAGERLATKGAAGRRALGHQVLQARGIIAGLADAALDAGWRDVEAKVEEALEKLDDVAELLGVLTRDR
jgi:hypothetical protein